MIDPEERALFNFFRARCGLTPVEFKAIYQAGGWLLVDEGCELPHCRRRLYLVVEGKVSCTSNFNGKWTQEFLKRSGQFFDLRYNQQGLQP